MYEVQGLKLNQIRTVFVGSVNDVIICKSINTQVENLYTLIVVKDSNSAKRMLDIIEDCETVLDDESPYVTRFVEDDKLIFVFKYYEERKLSSFMKSQIDEPYEKEQTSINFVMECMTSKIPYPLLMLQLEDENVNVNRDGVVYFNSFFDLLLLDVNITEKDCVNKLARTVRLLLSDLPEKKLKKLKSFILLDKKIHNNAYSTFPELYRDIKMTEISKKGMGLFGRIRAYFASIKDTLFRILMVLCVVLVIVAVVMIISRFVFGSSTLFSFRNRALEVIGTEILR